MEACLSINPWHLVVTCYRAYHNTKARCFLDLATVNIAITTPAPPTNNPSKILLCYSKRHSD